MSELRDAIDKALPGIMAEHSGHLVTEGVVKVAIMPSAADAIMALIEQSRPSREEFEHALAAWGASVRGYFDVIGTKKRPEIAERGQECGERYREVMRMAGYPEER